MINISTLALKLEKVKGGRYDIGGSVVNNPSDGAKLLQDLFEMEEQAEEIMVMLTLSTKHRVTGAFEISRGNLDSALVHPREIFKRAILNNSAAIIIGHNHPSGDATPSADDVAITKRLVEAGNILGINLIDHLIIGDSRYISFREKGLL